MPEWGQDSQVCTLAQGQFPVNVWSISSCHLILCPWGAGHRELVRSSGAQNPQSGMGELLSTELTPCLRSEDGGTPQMSGGDQGRQQEGGGAVAPRELSQ